MSPLSRKRIIAQHHTIRQNLRHYRSVWLGRYRIVPGLSITNFLASDGTAYSSGRCAQVRRSYGRTLEVWEGRKPRESKNDFPECDTKARRVDYVSIVAEDWGIIQVIPDTDEIPRPSRSRRTPGAQVDKLGGRRLADTHALAAAPGEQYCAYGQDEKHVACHERSGS